MEKAKQAIRDFTAKSGHHDTTVHSAAAPAVEHETVKPRHHEEIQTAVDREVHQDHYHQTVQHVKDKEILPEKHYAKLGAVQHKAYDHRDHDKTREQLAAESSQFKNEQRVAETTRTQELAANVEGERVHHHVHETIQPVIHKETIEPHVTHTTVPIHEVHHNRAVHHETSELPTISMNEFKKSGLEGHTERFDNFDGRPEEAGGVSGILERAHHSTKKPIEGTFHGDFDEEGRHDHHAGARVATTGSTTGSTTGLTSGSTTGATTGAAGAAATAAMTGSSKSSRVGESGLGHNKTSGSQSSNKPSLMDKINPKVDADGDGKPGFFK